MQAVQYKKKEHFALERGAITSNRPRLMLLEQLIDHVMKTNLMEDDELRAETYTIFTAVSNYIFNNSQVKKKINHNVVNFSLQAQDTTAVISAFALLNLAMNQEIQVNLLLRNLPFTNYLTFF